MRFPAGDQALHTVARLLEFARFDYRFVAAPRSRVGLDQRPFRGRPFRNRDFPVAGLTAAVTVAASAVQDMFVMERGCRMAAHCHATS